MSEQGRKSKKAAKTGRVEEDLQDVVDADAGAGGSEITSLMKDGAPAPARPDLDSAALRAAENALATGHRALRDAREHLEGRPQQRRSRGRELVLRSLLVLNMVLMVGVLMLPEPAPGKKPAADPGTGELRVVTPTPEPPAPVQEPRGGLYEQGLEAAASGDYARAIRLMENYLHQSPRMHVAQQTNVYHALAHYSFQLGDLKRSQEYDRKAASLLRSHTLPEDLVEMAHQAEQRGDADGLRRLWARFLLQQRQIPAAMYKHVAEAYLKLGDSYRLDASQAAEAARLKELEQLRANMREGEQGTKPPGEGGR